MGGGDLNLKKSWHPLTMRNLEKVWLAEQAAEKEKEKFEQLKKERQQERSLEEISNLKDGKSKSSKADGSMNWMYSGLSSSHSAQNEDFLLGRKKPKILAETSKELLGSNPHDKNLTWKTEKILSTNDLESKAREDPLLTIKSKESMLAQKLIASKKTIKKSHNHSINRKVEFCTSMNDVDPDFESFPSESKAADFNILTQFEDNYSYELAIALSKPVLTKEKRIAPLQATSVLLFEEATEEIQKRLRSIMDRWSPNKSIAYCN